MASETISSPARNASSRQNTGRTVSRRPALQELCQEPARPATLKKRARKPSNTKDVAIHIETADNIHQSACAMSEAHKDDQFDNVYAKTMLEPLEYESINNLPHSNRPSKRARHMGKPNFDIYIPEEFKQCPPDPLVSEEEIERPKTSRGKRNGDQTNIPSFTSMFPPAAGAVLQPSEMINTEERPPLSAWSDTTSDAPIADIATEDSGADVNESVPCTPRRSKFLEGSMNDRSQGVASSWPTDEEHNVGLEGVVEPRQSNGQRDSQPSTDSKESHVLPFVKDRNATSSPKKSKITKEPTYSSTTLSNGNIVHHFGQQEKATLSTKKSKGHGLGLRSSISNFSFQGISDMFKIFGSKSFVKSTESTSHGEEGELKALMNDRKRKAEAAYEEQFGFKKQRAENPNNANPISRTPHFSRPLNSITNLNTSQTTIRPPVPPAPQGKPPSASLRSRSSFSTLHKRPSRRDLEKENAHLRALLAEEQKQRKRLQSLSQVNVSGVDPDDVENQGVLDENSLMLVPGIGMGMIPGKDEPEDVPPVPKLPKTSCGGLGDLRDVVANGSVTTLELNPNEMGGKTSNRQQKGPSFADRKKQGGELSVKRTRARTSSDDPTANEQEFKPVLSDAVASLSEKLAERSFEWPEDCF
ncbi:hypothetical protein UCRPC4_g02264 [Phaeomoniella chlamydospora]|uniref:Uncharacterized protein n=1 Tax=Phaeomoniella chlamydospora TaxID=158046 RepID=A0A0G2GNC0_PHACM|nr:hypothetical protein UCRPC4_g02264 [Phaeomoniella chlamydospora]